MQVFVLLVLCGLCLASPVFFPEEAADGPSSVLSPSGGGGGSGASALVQKENADKDKLGEKALVAENVKPGGGAAAPGVFVNSEEDDNSASDEVAENSTEPVKKLLVRTFTDLHPQVALELINKTMSIVNATEMMEETNKAEVGVPSSTEVPVDGESTTAAATEATQETTTTGATTEKEPENTSSSSTTGHSSDSSSTTEASETTESLVTAASSGSSTTPKEETTTAAVHSSSSSSSTTETPSSTTPEMTKEKELTEIEAEIEADPVILTQGV